MTSTRTNQLASKTIPFTAFQALWIPGTTRLCSFGSNDGGFGAMQVHAYQDPDITSITTTRKRPTSMTPAGKTSSPRLVLQSETEKKVQFKSGTFRASDASATSVKLVTGDFEGRVGIWDLQRTEVPLSMFKAHEDVVNCMDGAGAQSGRPELVTGCRDGTVKLWDTRQKEEAVSTIAPKKGYGHDVWCVAMGNATSVDDLMIAAGYDNGDVRVMDMVAGKVVFETNITHGVCAIEFDKRKGKASSLVATTLEGALYAFDMVDGQFNGVMDQVAVQSGDDSTLWQARHIPQHTDTLAVTDGGGNLHLYKHGDDKTLMKALGSSKVASQGMLSLEFSEEVEGLYVGCDLDNTLRVGMVHL